MRTARELLEARREALVSQLNPLIEEYERIVKSVGTMSDKLNALTKEYEEIERALKAWDDTQQKQGRITIMDAVLEVLSRNPRGMTAREILAELNARYFGGRLQRHSLSPQLSRLKDRDKKIEYRNERWIRLPDQPSLFKRRL